MRFLRKATLVATAIAVLAFAGVASAIVTFDPVTGTGFVGKGDVQTAFAWNDTKLQRNAAGVSFVYNAVDTYSATCTWVTGEGTRGEQTHNVAIPRHTAVNSAVVPDARDNRNGNSNAGTISGFFLTNYGASTTDGTVPVAGDPCVGNPDGIDFNGTWSAVTLVSSTGGLYVVYNGNSVLIY